MTRQMSPEREAEFAEVLAFLDFYFNYVKKPEVTSGLGIQAEAERIAEVYGRSKALEGARQAVNDVIEELGDLKPEGVEILDEALRSAGIRTFSEVRRAYGRAYKKILKRGSIRTETEYYLVNGLVVDLASDIPPSERVLLQQMLSAYETPG